MRAEAARERGGGVLRRVPRGGQQRHACLVGRARAGSGQAGGLAVVAASPPAEAPSFRTSVSCLPVRGKACRGLLAASGGGCA